MGGIWMGSSRSRMLPGFGGKRPEHGVFKPHSPFLNPKAVFQNQNGKGEPEQPPQKLLLQPAWRNFIRAPQHFAICTLG